ncbi:N-acetyl-gamma-glutamyl-phosphate reductase [Aliikangiella sp. IMCC44359]|uniref:N-acetyl-gamma-glutamyl-phosphate reductase n=1 Tax=Aliikangiella sp. IMCC44359 TaxID=3459125 RepID=UPI00403A8175
MNNNQSTYTLGIIGVRGYVGKELLALVNQHPKLEIAWVSSRKLTGQPLNNLVENSSSILIENLSPEQVAAKNTDIIVLALPNGFASPYVDALEKNKSTQIIIDLSADYRFDKNWLYSIPELNNIKQGNYQLNKPIKISNPGCYATAMQLAIAPIKDLLKGYAHCFGVSGYSGAGTTPTPNNNLDNLKHNLIGYKLVEHLHEKEVSEKLDYPISFSPHVAEFFRGINMTIQIEFSQPQTQASIFNRFNDFYAMNDLVICQEAIPTLQQVVKTPHCVIGGLTVSKDGKRATIISCIDNLLKGAASQAIQNINLALGIEPTIGLTS